MAVSNGEYSNLFRVLGNASELHDWIVKLNKTDQDLFKTYISNLDDMDDLDEGIKVFESTVMQRRLRTMIRFLQMIRNEEKEKSNGKSVPT